MIHYFIPYATDKNLGKAYNYYASLVKNPEDWICFIDADAMIGLVPEYGHRLEEYISMYPDTGLFTCLTNRVGTLEQCYNNTISEDPNILNHKKIAVELATKNHGKVTQLNKVVSGMMFLIKKSVFDSVGGFPEDGRILGVDNKICEKILEKNLKILVIESIYLFHFYRMDTGRLDKSHLK